jgi:hypothetical protein
MTWKTFFHIYMDEIFKWIKCLDETSSKIVMLDENHMYMDESYKKHEIFG